MNNNFMIYRHNVSPYEAVLIRKTRRLKLFLPLLLCPLVVLLAVLGSFHPADPVSKDTYIADFRFDINKLTEVSQIIEMERTRPSKYSCGAFGTDGKILGPNEINPDLRSVLTKLSDSNQDGHLSDNEFLDLKIMRLKEDIYRKELQTQQFTDLSCDHNLKNYIIITQGKAAGTVLYNGPLKFINSENKRYFAIELFTE